MHPSRLFLLALPLSIVAACNSPRGVRNDAATPGDAASADSGVADATIDAGPRDVGLADVGPRDGGPRDAGLRDVGVDASRDAGSDTGARDVGVDAPRDSAVVDGGPLGGIIQCAPPAPAGATSGIVFSTMFWSGFRFEITGAGAQITRVGLQITPDGAGTIFGAIVRLTGSGDTPDDPAIAGADVLMRTTFPVPASGGVAIVASGLIDVTVPPGWYAVVFGTGAFGATATGTIPSGGGAGCIASPGSSYPFTINQSSGMFILQGAQPHFFVEVAP